ncbi:MAG: hypothetical protein J5584_09720 [Clostridia bacterium]|nr:hypothetical protein [Clostridia bacterium]
MTDKEFKEAMQAIAGREDSAQYYNGVANFKKKRKAFGTGLVCVAIAAAAVIAVTLGISLSRTNGRKAPSIDQEPVLAGPTQTTAPMPTTAPDAATVPASTTLPAPTTAPATPENHAGSDWFGAASLNVVPLSYAGLDQSLNSLDAAGFGAELIPASVMGEHAECPGVYYNPLNNEIICLYHEFLRASGVNIPDGQYPEFNPDKVRSGLVAVRIYDTVSVETVDMWIFDRITGTAARVALPDGANSYRELGLYGDCLWDGRLCISINTGSDRHFVDVYNVDDGGSLRIWDHIDGPGVTGSFLTDNIMEISAAGTYFYNIDTGVIAEVAGEYNYSIGGKVYSVKNNGWALHTEVEVAAYDAATGARLENEPVLVRTVLDDGTRVFLVKNSTTGAETVIVRNYAQNCCAWSKDHAYFYAFSEAERRIVCYSAADGEWFTAQCPGISTEPVIRDGKEYAVHADYAIAVADNARDVYIYYSRTFEEIPEIPDYADEKVDSTYWDAYREIKARNFDGETVFYVGHKENIVDSVQISYECYDMDVLRDFILKCLEQRGEELEWLTRGTGYKYLDSYYSCGVFSLDVYDFNGRYLISMGGNPTSYYGHGMYEIPESLFLELHEFNHRSNTVMLETVDVDDARYAQIKAILQSDRWEAGSGAFTTYNYTFKDGDRRFLYCFETGMINLLVNPPDQQHLLLTEEERQLVNSLLGAPGH